MNATIRATARLTGFTFVTLGMYALWLAGIPFAANRSRWRAFAFKRWAAAVAHVVGMRVHATGPAPRPPFFLVSNHLSYVDIVLLAVHLDCVFVARQDLRNWPVLGFLIRSMDTIFVDRHRRRDVERVNALIEQALRAGEGVVLFAEGTSTRGERVLPLRPSLLETPARRGYPVSYASLSYRVPSGCEPAHESVCWWGDMTFTDHFFDLLKLPYFEAQLTFGNVPVHDTDRKLLALRLHRLIRELFTPVVAPTAEQP